MLGFNEPDNSVQANMPVSEATALWPIVEDIGIPLASPATVNALGTWMTEFMASEMRADYVAVHWYGGTSPQGFKDNMQQIYDTYGLPLLITGKCMTYSA
jgi:hypothetical protein